MAYSSYELASGDALAEVQRLCRHAARANGAFTTATVPSLSAVEQWLTTSYYMLGAILRKAGLSETQTAVSVVGVLQQAMVYDTCMKVELSLPTEAAGAGPSARYVMFKELRDEFWTAIRDGTIAGIDATVDSTLQRTPYVGGLSISRKTLMVDDTDATQHRIRRGQFQRQGIIPIGISPKALSDEESAS